MHNLSPVFMLQVHDINYRLAEKFLSFKKEHTLMVYNKEDVRKKSEEIRWKENVRDSISLRNKSPQETLKMMFELCEFTQKLRRAVNEKF